MEPLEGPARREASPGLIRILQKIVAWVRSLLGKVGKFLFNHRYHIDDIIAIVRPLVYLYAVAKYGSKSWAPIKISLVLDVIQILVSLSRLVQAGTPRP